MARETTSPLREAGSYFSLVSELSFLEALGIFVSLQGTFKGLRGFPELLFDFFLVEAKPVPALFLMTASDAEAPPLMPFCDPLSKWCFLDEVIGLSRYTTSSRLGLTIFSRMKSEEVMLLTESKEDYFWSGR